jgi:Regulator of chromosome condensation (RCC1) repeat
VHPGIRGINAVISIQLRVFDLQKMQLGLGDRMQRNMPCAVPGMAGKVCVHGACGKHHTVAVISDGKSFSWGFNGAGQTGTAEVKLFVRAHLYAAACAPLPIWRPKSRHVFRVLKRLSFVAAKVLAYIACIPACAHAART